jgi:hypothetical protein
MRHIATRFFSGVQAVTPAVRFPSPRKDPELRGPNHLDLRASTAAFLLEGERVCGGCGVRRPLSEWSRDASKPSGLGSLCRACTRRRSRQFYARNRERILARAAARRGPPLVRFCSECGVELEGRHRVTCGKSSCREARFRRLHPEAYAAKEARKVERRRQARRRASGSRHRLTAT